MKKYYTIIIVLFLIFQTAIIVSCKNDKGENGNAKEADKQSTDNFAEGKDYTIFKRFRLMDKNGFAEPVEAYSLMLPKDWTLDGDVVWVPVGQPCQGTSRNFKATSADGKYSYEVFPVLTWSFTEDQQMAYFMQQQTTKNCRFDKPMNAEEYTTSQFLAEIGNPTISNVQRNNEVIKELEKNMDKYRSEFASRGATFQTNNDAITADLKFSDGNEGFLMVSVSNGTLTIPNVYNGTYTQNYTSTSPTRIIFKYPKGEKEKAKELFTTIYSSFKTNPVWNETVEKYWRDNRNKSYAESMNTIRLMDERTKQIAQQTIENGKKSLANIDNQMRSWEAKQASQDRMHTAFIKTIRGVENYQDSNGTVEVQSGYNHVWSKNDNNTILMTNSPNFDPSSVFQDQNWKEMKKLE